MDIDLIYRVFKEIDKDLEGELDETEFKLHLHERTTDFWSALKKIEKADRLDRLEKRGVYDEFMEK